MHRLSHFFQSLKSSFFSSFINKNLLSEEELQALVTRILADNNKFANLVNMPSYSNYLGPQDSVFRGPGMELIENRKYVSGDELKLINWRMSARLNQLHSKVYTEDKQTQVIIVLDRRASMRFGSTVRLKVTQAAYSAIILAVKAYCRQASVALVCLQAETKFFDFNHNLNHIIASLHSAIAPAPPVSFADEYSAPNLAESLEQVAVKFGSGNLIYFISDFIDLLEYGDDFLDSSLSKLSKGNQLSMIQVSDPAEINLPDVGTISLVRSKEEEQTELDTSSQSYRSTYKLASEVFMAKVRGKLDEYGDKQIQLFTSDIAIDKLTDW